jgi:hypothetical protein
MSKTINTKTTEKDFKVIRDIYGELVGHIKYDPNRFTLVVKRFLTKKMASDYNPKFKYPLSGSVESEKWDNSATCGGGLHGWENGMGKRGAVWDKHDDLAKSSRSPMTWMVILTSKSKKNFVRIKDLIDWEVCTKTKFHRGYVVFVGTHAEMVKFVMDSQIESGAKVTPHHKFVTDRI